MIDLKERPEAGWYAILSLSLVAICVLSWFAFIHPPGAGVTGSNSLAVGKIESSTAKTNTDSDAVEKTVLARTWRIDAEELGSKTLDSLSKMAEKKHVQLVDFRTEKATDVVDMKEAPFVVIVEGTFSDMLGFVSALEAPDSKLAVNMMQVSASDVTAGHVTATLGLVGFLYKEIAHA